MPMTRLRNAGGLGLLAAVGLVWLYDAEVGFLAAFFGQFVAVAGFYLFAERGNATLTRITGRPDPTDPSADPSDAERERLAEREDRDPGVELADRYAPDRLGTVDLKYAAAAFFGTLLLGFVAITFRAWRFL